MQMAYLSTIFLLLPLFFAVFLAAPRPARPAVLLLASLAFYLLVQPALLPLMLLLVAFDWAALMVMDRFSHQPRVRRGCVWFAVLKNLLTIFYMSALVQVRAVGEALGLLVYCLSGMGCVIEAYKGEVAPERNPIRFFLYCCFFPKLYAGPLVSYAEFGPQMDQMRLRPGQCLAGVGLYIRGAAKYTLLGVGMQELYETLRLYRGEDVTVLSAWLLLVAFALSLYFRLSGLCDMARGIGGLFGLRLPRNFYYPYQSHSVTDFFDRFNITVSALIRRTVYAGLQEDQNGPLADSLNILVVCMLMGLWFGFRLNLLAWGVYLAAFVIAERYLYPGVMRAVPVFFRRIYALCVVLSSFALFAGDSLRESASLAAGMLGFGTAALVNDKLQYLIASNWLLLSAGLFFATSAVHLADSALRRYLPRFGAAVAGVVDVGVLGLLVAMMM